MREVTEGNTESETAAKTAPGIIAITMNTTIRPALENAGQTKTMSRVTVTRMDTDISARDTPATTAIAPTTTRISDGTDTTAEMSWNRTRKRSSSRSQLA